MIHKVALAFVWRRAGEESLVQTQFGFFVIGGRHPMNNTLRIHAVFRVFTKGILNQLRLHERDIAIGVFLVIGCFNHIRETQTDAFARTELLLELLAVLFFEVVLINKDFTRKWHLTLAQVQLWVERRFEHFFVVFGQIFNDHFQWFEYGHGARCILVQVATQRVLQHGNINHAITTGHTNHVAEGAN